jgi:hypothetical protein
MNFGPVDYVTYHEVGHALVAHATGAGIGRIRVERFGHEGIVQFKNAPIGPRTHYRLSMAGPISQRINCPRSVVDPMLQGRLFDLERANDRSWWATFRGRVADARVGWASDLEPFYAAICEAYPNDLIPFIAPFAAAEASVSSFLSLPAIRIATAALYGPLHDRGELDGKEAEAILSVHPAVHGLGPYSA